ncbi:MAG: class I tRNA ligase family protein [Candidatus Paceibacterota bacterium]|jgi:leucyl-tRNA synthetase
MKSYDHKAIETKWQAVWEKDGSFTATEDINKKKFYALVEFPYPSGDGLHTGHARSYTAMDVICRKRRREGYSVLYPIGWDAFGLPTENYAIKTGRQPADITKENTDTFRRQLKALGYSFDWNREIDTSDPKYYKWTQWIFLQLLKNGLAYRGKATVNWCPKDKITLANEEAVGGVCDRCGGPTETREKEQWMLAITKYAGRLYDDLDQTDYLPKIITQQRNWIGKSEGHNIKFKVESEKLKVDTYIEVFTTRIDTIFGVTYIVLAPEHALLQTLELSNDVKEYVERAKNKQDMERTADDKEKTGVELKGIKAINPANNEEIPVWVADYVLGHYGTGAVMAVPAHDDRDNAFAKKYSLPSKPEAPFATKEQAVSFGATEKTTFKLRDWVFSRQRYWGEPIPVVHCLICGIVPLDESELPLTLPIVEKYQPTDTGESPLAAIDDWVNTICPHCGGPAKRETDTMPNWAGSSWYYLAYVMQGISNFEFPISNYADAFKYWTPVDWYNGGMEHATLHLLYSRFWHKFLFDIKAVPTSEPYIKRTAQGMILSHGGIKMSKSKGNVISPDEFVQKFGADTLRLYELFMGPFDQAIAWNTDSLVGVYRFIERVVNLSEKVSKEAPIGDIEILLNQTIKKVSEDIEEMKFNTAISSLMILVNELAKEAKISTDSYGVLLQLLSPFAPHVTEELWGGLGHSTSIHAVSWPIFDTAKLQADTVELVIQIGGKVRGRLNVKRGISEKEAINMVYSDESIKKWLVEGQPRKTVFVPDRLLNIVL